MSTPIEVVLSRLAPYKLRENGRDRWRACCPAHGGSNPSALSIGIGHGGGVLLKCWHGCGAQEVAHALGLELGELFPPRDSHMPRPRRIAMLTASQALEVVGFECLLIWTAAFNLANGHALTTDDLQRLATAARRVQTIIDEVRA